MWKAGQHVCSILGIEAFGNLNNQDQITKLKPILHVNPDLHSPRVKHEIYVWDHWTWRPPMETFLCSFIKLSREHVAFAWNHFL